MGDSRLASPQDNLRSFVKMRGSLEPNEEVVFHWKGILYSYVPEEGLPLQKSQKALLRLEGFDVARFVPVEGGYHMLSRAVILYEEPSSGRNTTTWGAFKQLVDSGRYTPSCPP